MHQIISNAVNNKQTSYIEIISFMDSLKQKNKKSLNGIEMSLGETKIITIPTQVREEELNLLRTAVNFQPELYEKISMIPTRKEMDVYMKEVLNIDVKYYQKMVDTYQKELTTLRKDIFSNMEQTEKNIRTIQSEMQASIKQAGRNQESYLKDTLQKGSELEKRIAEQAKKAGAFTAVKWILISVLSSTVSTLLLHLFLK